MIRISSTPLRSIISISNKSILNTTTNQLNKRFLQTNVNFINNNRSNSSSIFNSTTSKWSPHQLSIPKESENLTNTVQQQKPTTQKKRRRQLKPRKQLITLSPNAIHHLTNLMNQPNPQLIRIGVRNRGCSGLSYHLEYVSKPEKFDEMIEQDGVKVLIDSKALFSVVGSEMDWVDDKLSSKFVFKNPNSKGTCGCGESFMV